ncbi:hypothetical protein Ocin01_02659 [Orchesella cincta]|uniref:Uncharacterized protein n=1 Tax=Orchesella cincta TaxID=48709 RepID=A0A1D2NFG0_ORCCI|nr:hypothetical protein Ocin01_02659 [Orchesella cincta]
MASNTFIFLAIFASTVSMILSIPQLNQLPIREPIDSNNPVAPDAVPDNLPNINPRTFGSLFNLSAYLANAPTNSAALNFIPLITILSALG